LSSDLLYDEKRLLRQLAESNDKAFDLIYTTYADRLYGVAFAYTKSADFSEEVVQEVFLKLWEKRQELSHVESIEAYIYMMTRNAVINKLRTLTREREAFKKLAAFFENNTRTPEQELSFKESNQLIETAVSNLTEQQQLVYRLVRQEGLTREEVARRLNISENTVRNHMAKALQYIKAYVQQHSSGLVCLLALLLLEL